MRVRCKRRDVRGRGMDGVYKGWSDEFGHGVGGAYGFNAGMMGCGRDGREAERGSMYSRQDSMKSTVSQLI